MALPSLFGTLACAKVLGMGSSQRRDVDLMSGFEWFLLVVVVILVPLIVAVMITLWTLEQARKRNRKNREPGDPASGPVKRRATRDAAAPVVAAPLADQALAGMATNIALADDAIAAPAEGGVAWGVEAEPGLSDDWQRSSPSVAEAAASETTLGPVENIDDSSPSDSEDAPAG